MMLLYSYNINNSLIVKETKHKLVEYYVREGISILSSKVGVGSYAESYAIDNDWILSIEKAPWGTFDIYTSTVTTNGDTLSSKQMLIGKGNPNDSIALRLANNGILVHIGDSVDIKGKSIVPFEMMSPYGYKGFREIPKRLVAAKDTLPPLSSDSLFAWMQSFGLPANGKLYISDTVINTFHNPTKLFSADTVIISNKIAGNVVVVANVIIVEDSVCLEDPILTAKYIFIDDNFNGSIQCIASSGMTIGEHCKFNYPTVLGLFTDSLSYGGTISIGDSLFLQGEIYASSKVAAYKKYVSVIVNNGFVLGNLYSTGSVQYSGICVGSITCEKILGRADISIEENYLRNIFLDRDKLPDFFDCSRLNPFASRNKAVKWLN